MKGIKLFVHLCFCVSLINAQTQPPLRFQHLSVDERLSSNQVFAITQDRHGFIWVATYDGLNRFDGYNVEIFRNKMGDKKSLPSNAVTNLFTDSRGIVWIGTSSGLAYYDEQTSSFRSFFNNPKDKNSLVYNLINVINEDGRGLLWIGTPRGLCSFDIGKNRFEQYLHDDHSKNSISSDAIRDISFSPDGTMWIATNNGLNRLDPATTTFTYFFHDPADGLSLSGNAISRIAIDKSGNLWTFPVNTFNLDCFDTKTFRCKHFNNLFKKQSPIATNFLFSLFIDRSDRLWAGTSQSGLYLLYPDRNTFFEYKTDRFDPDALQSNYINRMYQDRSGMIWLGTDNAGVERFNPDESKFMVYRFHSDESLSYENKSVQAIAEDASNNLWIGTSDGLSILDRSTGKFKDYHWNQGDTNSLSVNFVTAICGDKQGNMWIGTRHGLNLFDPVHDRFRGFYAENNNHSLGSNFITNIICDNKGDLLINSRGAPYGDVTTSSNSQSKHLRRSKSITTMLPIAGTNAGSGAITLYDSKTQQFRNFKNDTIHPFLRFQTEIIFEDKNDVLWIGTRNNGLVRYNRQTDKAEIFINKGDDTRSIPSNHIGSIAQDHKGIIWVGTGAGLCYFNEKTHSFKTFAVEDGLPDARIRQLLVDGKDRIWMSSNRGISVLDESRTHFTNYDPSDGLQGWDFSESSAFRTHDGYFCYGGNNGFNMFHPDSIEKNPFTPAVVLRGIKIFDQPLKIDNSFTNLKSLRLSYKQDFFSFEFAAFNYDHPEKNQYACQLIPFDKDTVQLGTKHSISYTNVPPGSYTLKVLASNNDGVWNKAGYELKLIIVPPFWATMWFRAIVIATILGTFFLYFKFRENRIKKEQFRQTAINKQIAEIRMSALQAQMNPHFIFNSLNSIQHLISIHEKEEAINCLSKFSKLIRKMLENSRENTVTISNELELLELYIQLEQLRFNHKFDYHVSVDESIDMESTEIPPLIIQPYIENAILHGLINKNGKGDLWFSLERNNGSLICKIQDNGVGRARAQQIEQKKISKHKSLGIKVTDERISTLSTLLDSKMDVVIEDLFETRHAEEARQPAGTRVTITIPLKEEE